APFLPVVADRQEDRLGSHVDLSAPRARRPDGCHLTGVIGPGAKGLEQTSAERGYPMWAGQVAYRARVRRAKSWTRSRSSGGSRMSASGPARSINPATHPSRFAGIVTSTDPSPASSAAVVS